MAVSKQFILAGDAIFTIETAKGEHRTYRVCKADPTERYPNPAFFVKMLTGPDNEADYTYIGKLDPFTGQTTITKASKIKQDNWSMILLNKVLARVWTDDHNAYEQHGFKTHHEGCCGRCGRTLTVPESVETGIGPECAEIMGIVRKTKKTRKRKAKATINPPTDNAGYGDSIPSQNYADGTRRYEDDPVGIRNVDR